ncbi:uncharacterized protein LOC143566128 [Bidens hawaiensis]|uniref:uncharacterized protein LOC143566128 n=1 Tax=Bidens hawaiensis TaxID=980011 RepID=UPI004049B634
MPTEKKKSVLQSLHSSIKFPASLNKSLNLKTFTKPKDRPIQEPLTMVPSVNAVKKTSQVLPRPENKRSNPLLSCSLNSSKATVLKSVSINHSEASIASTKKPRSTTVFSSFSFKSDERAAKRKEFFQKLEEKGNINKTEKTRLQPKLKVINILPRFWRMTKITFIIDKINFFLQEKGNKKLPWGGVPQEKISTSETTRPSNIIQKVPPKLGKKNFIEINKKKLSSSMACLPSKKLHDYSTLMLKS